MPRVEHAWQSLVGVSHDLSPEIIRRLPRVLAASDFFAHWCAADPRRLPSLAAEGGLLDTPMAGDLRARVAAMLGSPADPAALSRALRQIRNREMARIAWRDISGLATLDETMRHLSSLAEALLQAALDPLHAWQDDALGTPVGHSGATQRLFVIAMGKLGAGELNFSSDIDIVLAYPEQGATTGSRLTLDNEEYFTRLGRRLVRMLGDVTEDGFVYRVDLRLRPFGDSGPIVLSAGAMEAYYETHARDWERYALIKARVVAGDRTAGGRLLDALRPFVYRRYIDFGALASLREMKSAIRAEVSRRGLEGDLKRGRGGIREVEFIAQCLQLIRGGRERALQTPSLFQAMQAIRELGLLDAAATDELVAAYRFLRTVEHRLQEVADEQTQSLPADETERLRLACSMGYATWSHFAADLEAHRQRVHARFESLLERAENGERPERNLWRDASEKSADEAFAGAGFDDGRAVAEAVTRLRESPRLRRLSAAARSRLDELMPRLLARAAALPSSSRALLRVLPLMENIAGRSAYLALLNEYPQAIDHLLTLCSESQWLARLIARQPVLLDDLLDARTLYSPPAGPALERELRNRLDRAPANDLERQLDVLREFKNSHVLRVAAADVVGHLPVAEVSNRLTAIAEAVIRGALNLAWRDVAQLHGRPMCGADGMRREARFAVIAYGKLGGLELGYGSDLDLVFLHDSSGEMQQSDGTRPLDNALYFTRLGQRVIHFITTTTSAGRAYEVDARLRPSGNSGLLVSPIAAFRDYQLHSAWTWEHQALIRARAVAGRGALGQAFTAVRQEVLGRERDHRALKSSIREMRARMRAEHTVDADTSFDLKSGPGGMTDIEFMVQYAVLRWGHAHPELLEFTDNLRTLEALARSELVPAVDCRAMQQAYFAFRAEAHRCALQESEAVAGASSFTQERALVARIWRELMEGD